MRRKVRETALQILFQMDLRKKTLSEILSVFKIPSNWKDDDRSFFLSLVRGVEQNLPEIERIISAYSLDWPLYRMPTIDRNLLRIAVFEMFYLSDISVGVSINEAVELAKKFSTTDSGKFVNGILGKLARSSQAEFKSLGVNKKE
ncbi:MAG TPA: transcription antitermination factor NusB [Candidatus Atribacteria bacterium]|nr:transcription antitermination factor NusB [Candidatus Atribacteria bacterium]HCU22683.1 transcription antitermination factor NusB [Candidatus Atribacteria bacterium]